MNIIFTTLTDKLQSSVHLLLSIYKLFYPITADEGAAHLRAAGMRAQKEAKFTLFTGNTPKSRSVLHIKITITKKSSEYFQIIWLTVSTINNGLSFSVKTPKNC